MGFEKEARARSEHGPKDRDSILESGWKLLLEECPSSPLSWYHLGGYERHLPEWYPEGKWLDLSCIPEQAELFLSLSTGLCAYSGQKDGSLVTGSTQVSLFLF